MNVNSRQNLHQNRWFDHYVDDVVQPDGRHVPEHHVIHFHRGSVGIVAINDSDEILMVRIYRHPVGRFGWETPAGGMNETETAIETAARELLEETGYRSSGGRLIYSYCPINGISNKEVHVVTCKVEGQPSDATDGEVAEIRWFNRTELSEMIERNDIRDGFTLTGLLLLGIGCKPAFPKKG